MKYIYVFFFLTLLTYCSNINKRPNIIENRKTESRQMTIDEKIKFPTCDETVKDITTSTIKYKIITCNSSILILTMDN